MAEHFIVCGFGRVGYRIVELLLRLGEEVTVVVLSVREEWQAETRRSGVTLVIGDARNEQTLIEAGLLQAKALIAAVDQDLVNIEIALDAKRLRPDLPVVVRLFDQTLAQQMEGGFDLRRALAISTLAAPTFAAAAMGERVIGSFRLDDALLVVGRFVIEADAPLAERTVQQISSDNRLMTLLLERADGLEIAPTAETVVRAGDRLTLIGFSEAWKALTGQPADEPDGRSRLNRRLKPYLQGLQPLFWLDLIRQVWRGASLPLRTVFLTLNLLILLSVVIFHFGTHLSLLDAFYFIIATVTTVGYGDITPMNFPPLFKLYTCLMMLMGSATVATLFSIITEYVVTARFMQILGRQRIPQENHFIVAGLGNVGYRLVEKLKLLGAQVVVIERDPNSRYIETVRAQTPVILGDARLPETLKKASVNRARAVLAVTDDDAANLGIALEVKRVAPEVRTVARLFDTEFARKVQSALNIDVAMGAFTLAAPTFVAAALYPYVRHAFVCNDHLFSILDRQAGAEWSGRRPSELRRAGDVRILMRKPAGAAQFVLAEDDTPLRQGEQVLAVVWREMHT